MKWKSRIIERRRMTGRELMVNQFNPKNHPDFQLAGLEKVLDRFGKVDGLIAYHSERNDGKLTIFNGHGRQMLDPDEVWDVAITDLTDKEVDELVLYFDPIAAMAQQDEQITQTLLSQVEAGDEGLQWLLENVVTTQQDTDDAMQYLANQPVDIEQPLVIDNDTRQQLEALKQVYGAEDIGEVVKRAVEDAKDKVADEILYTDDVAGDWDSAFGKLPDEDRQPFQQMTFTLHDSQVEIIKEALSLARKNDFSGSPNENSNGNALGFICQEFIVGNS